MAGKEELAVSFDGAVGEYEHGRPGYPEEMVDWVLRQLPDRTAGPDAAERLPDGAEPLPDVVDVGAGTGKLTSSLAARPLNLSAVEPLPQMRARLAGKLPTIPVYAGSAENLPLADASVDLATYAQVWHWVDAIAASAEAARVLRAGGRIALIWNLRDISVGWVRALFDVMGASASEEYDSVHPELALPLRRIEFAEFSWERRLRRDELHALISSRSYVITMSAEERAVLGDRVDELLDTHPDLRGRDTYVLPYITRVTIAG